MFEGRAETSGSFFAAGAVRELVGRLNWERWDALPGVSLSHFKLREFLRQKPSSLIVERPCSRQLAWRDKRSRRRLSSLVEPSL